MVKGHNKIKGGGNDPDQIEKGKGQDRHLTQKKRGKLPVKGRNREEDQSGGRKKKNPVK